MGQAKARGSLEERKEMACAAELEQKRLDQWLQSRRPSPKRKKSMALMTMLLAGGVFAVTHPYSSDRR